MDWLELKAPVDIIIKVDISVKDDAKVVGAKWSVKDKTWYIPKGEWIKYFVEWFPPDKKLRTLNDEILYVKYDENEKAREIGASWDWEIKRWILPAGTDIRKVPYMFFSENNINEIKVKKSFYDLVSELGLVLNGEPVANGRIQRVPLVDSKLGKKDGAYLIYNNISGGWGGYVQNFKTGQKETFKDYELLDDYQREEIIKKREEKQQEIGQLQEKSAKRASYLIKGYKPASATHLYLQRKKIQPYGVFVNERGQLAVVLQDVRGHIRSLQFIDDDGRKIYLYGGQKRGCFHMIGGTRGLFKTDFERIIICEGFATGASIYEATGWTVICAMDCGNMLAVGQELYSEYKYYGDFKIIFAGDDDHSAKGNPGRRFAEEAANALNGIAIFPEFTPEEMLQGLTDFNDLAQVRGLKVVGRQLITSHHQW